MSVHGHYELVSVAQDKAMVSVRLSHCALHCQQRINQQNHFIVVINTVGYDCGVFTCMIAFMIANDFRPTITQDEVDDCCEHIALSIIQGVANDVFVYQVDESPDNLEGEEDEQTTKRSLSMEDSDDEEESLTSTSEERTFHKDLYISKPSTHDMQHVSRCLGGKAGMSTYEHFLCTEIIDKERYHKYTDFENAMYSTTVPGSELAGKVIAAQDNGRLDHHQLIHDMLRYYCKTIISNSYVLIALVLTLNSHQMLVKISTQSSTNLHIEKKTLVRQSCRHIEIHNATCAHSHLMRIQ